MDTPNSLEKAITAAGSMTNIAKEAGVTLEAVRQWRASGKVPARRIPAVVRASKGEVSHFDLMTDIYRDDDKTVNQ